MKKQIEQLKEFHKVYGLPIRNTPTLLPVKEFEMRHRILREEVDELSDAHFNNDIVEVADALCDIMYIAIGTAVQFGLGDILEECFEEVHRSNMSKLDENGHPIYRADGKVLKGNLWSPPDLIKIINNEKESF